MKTTVEKTGGQLILRFSGELDHHAAVGAVAEIAARIDLTLPRECVIDMENLSFMDSSGIAVVLKAYRHMEETGGRLTLRNVPPQPMRVLAAAGIDKLVCVEGGLHNERA